MKQFYQVVIWEGDKIILKLEQYNYKGVYIFIRKKLEEIAMMDEEYFLER